MAHQGADRPPFDACLQLTAWAQQYAPYLRGRLLLAGHRLGYLSAGEVLDASLAAMVELAGSRFQLLDALTVQLAKPALPRRDTWGDDPQARQAQRAMMATAPGGAGPAPKRSPDAKRPEAWKSRPGGDTPT